ncbi:MAG: carbon monoxide dehydrogenase [Gemmatimonadota bacterium]|nr:MAG: carbon monoxide dehydrogenase [Gemmatimonadota bacterium]
MKIPMTVNGLPVEVDVPPLKRLLDVLRDDLGFTGTKYGCGEGECGACTVRIDGEVAMSCLVPAAQAAGTTVQTVEGLATDDVLHELQHQFLETGGAQCGICTPGMLMMAVDHLEHGGALDDATVREVLAGNICRCTGYVRIVDAVQRAGRALAPDEDEPRPGGAA